MTRIPLVATPLQHSRTRILMAIDIRPEDEWADIIAGELVAAEQRGFNKGVEHIRSEFHKVFPHPAEIH